MPFLSSEQRAAIAIGVPVVALLLYLWYRRRQNSQFSDEDEDFTQVEESEEVASTNQRTIEVRVPQAVVGAIIGKSGVNIKKIEKDTGVRLNLKDENEGSESEERIVLIQGEREKAKRAEILVKKIIAEQPVIRTEEIFIPQRACGRIIGKGGQTIRHLCSISGAKIRIGRDHEDMLSPLRKCTVTGTYDQIASAKGLLDEKIAEDNEIRARRGDIGMPQNRHAPRKLDTALASPITGVLQFPKTNEFFAVFVSAIDNPGHFWVQLLTKDSPDLDKLTNDLTFLCSSSESHSVLNAFKVGDICCAPFEYDSSWYRARILEINKDGMVDLYYVDFGDSGKIHKEKLRELKQEHSRIPFQAIECYLADVRPKDGEWSKEATDEFDQLTHCAQWVSVMARVVKYDGDIPCVQLIDTTGQTDVNINEEMIRAQFAYRDVSCTADERELVSELVQDALQATPVEIKQSSTEQQELIPPRADTAGEINGETTQHVMETIQGQKSSDALSKPSSTDVKDGPPSGDVTDSCPELHGPVVAESDSPVKAALVKSISRDYIAAPVNSSPDVLNEGRASLSIVQEQGIKAGSGSGVHGVQSQHEASNSPGKNVEEFHSTSQEKAAYRSSLNIAASSRRTMAATFSGSRHGSERSESSGKPVTSTVHRQMVSSKQSYISTVTLPERDTNNVVVSVLPSVTQLQAKSPFDLESHAFKASNGNTTLTRHAVTSEVHRTVTQSNGRDTTNEFSSQRVEEKLASRMSPSDEKPTVKYEINFESIKGIPVAEHYTIKKTFSQLESGPLAGFEALDSASSVAGSENTVSTASASSSGRNNGSEQSGNFISRGSSEETGGDMSPSGSLLDIAKNDVIDEEEEEEEEDDDEQADQDDATADSPEQDSDEESFISAREDVTSDTDTAAYMTAPPGGSSTSLDTDVALGDSAADETITPVNSDTEVEHEEEAEEAGFRGDATPRPAAEAGKDCSRSGTLKGLKDQVTALGGAITSDGDLGYSGDSEEGLESAEDLRTAST